MAHITHTVTARVEVRLDAAERFEAVSDLSLPFDVDGFFLGLDSPSQSELIVSLEGWAIKKEGTVGYVRRHRVYKVTDILIGHHFTETFTETFMFLVRDAISRWDNLGSHIPTFSTLTGVVDPKSA